MSKKINLKYLEPIIIILTIVAAYQIISRRPVYGNYRYTIEISGSKLEDCCAAYFNRHPEYIAWRTDRNGKFINPNYDSTQTRYYPKFPPKSKIHKYYFRLPVNDSVNVTILTGVFIGKSEYKSCSFYIGGYSYDNELKRWKYNKKEPDEEQQKILNLFEEKVLNEMNVSYERSGETL